MSISLVRKSLDLVSTDDHVACNSNGEYTNSQLNIKLKYKPKKKASVDKKKDAAIIVQKLRQKVKADRNVDKVEINVQKLLKLSKRNSIQNRKEYKILRNISKNKEECPDSHSKQKPAFSEEDFAKFEKEYFAN